MAATGNVVVPTSGFGSVSRLLPEAQKDAMATRTPRITTLCYPRADRAFLHSVASALTALDGDEPTPARLADRLRGEYPRISVVAQEPLADLWHDGEQVWYVYRDGGLLGGAASATDP